MTFAHTSCVLPQSHPWGQGTECCAVTGLTLTRGLGTWGHPRAWCQVSGGGDTCPDRKGVLGGLKPYDCYRDSERSFSPLCSFPVAPGRPAVGHGDEGKGSGATLRRKREPADMKADLGSCGPSPWLPFSWELGLVVGPWPSAGDSSHWAGHERRARRPAVCGDSPGRSFHPFLRYKCPTGDSDLLIPVLCSVGPGLP